MKDKVEIFQEHGGVLRSQFGRAEAIYFGPQISVGDNEVRISPSMLKIRITPDEKALFSSFSKPVTGRLLFGRAKSTISDLAFLDCDCNEKRALLRSLKSEINQLLDKI